MTSLPEKPPSGPTIAEPAEEFISLDSTVERNKSKPPSAENDTASPSPQSEKAPPLPSEPLPPLPNEVVPNQPVDDGWEPVWDETAQSFYFYNRITNVTQWENPRILPAGGAIDTGPPGVEDTPLPKKSVAGGYDPAIHGDYDPDADYAKTDQLETNGTSQIDAASTDPTQAYAATGAFNRFTGKWQKADLNPENFNDENKSKRQMNAFFDVDAAANSHDGRSLKAERSGKKLSKKELKAFKEKRREKKEEKRRAWLRD